MLLPIIQEAQPVVVAAAVWTPATLEQAAQTLALDSGKLLQHLLLAEQEESQPLQLVLLGRLPVQSGLGTPVAAAALAGTAVASVALAISEAGEAAGVQQLRLLGHTPLVMADRAAAAISLSSRSKEKQ
jgi:hypothetical protein